MMLANIRLFEENISFVNISIDEIPNIFLRISHIDLTLCMTFQSTMLSNKKQLCLISCYESKMSLNSCRVLPNWLPKSSDFD